MTTATELFRRARDFLLEHREDYTAAYEGFAWPRPQYFNWALDWFDVIADGNDRTALHIVEEDGSEVRLSFAWKELPPNRLEAAKRAAALCPIHATLSHGLTPVVVEGKVA